MGIKIVNGGGISEPARPSCKPESGTELKRTPGLEIEHTVPDELCLLSWFRSRGGFLEIGIGQASFIFTSFFTPVFVPRDIRLRRGVLVDR